MNFVAQLEDYLRDLGSEARKKHPGVKEASERAILRLRTLQNSYVSAVRKASNSGAEHPTTSLFQSQDLLHPFLLAANYPNASTKLLDISFKAMRLLMESSAICPGDGIHMVRVWTIQAHVIMSQYFKTNKSTKSGTDPANNPASSSANESGTTSAKSTASSTASLASSTASWLGGWVGGSTSTATSAAAAATADAASKAIKNAVSSSSGQSGQYSSPSNREMEKIALEILSCLLQLTELLKKESLEIDLWTQSVSLCCLLLDFKKTVQQAAHSTLPQVLSVMYQTSDSNKYNLQTWEDLLILASYSPQKKLPTFHGAFSQCRLDTSSFKAPPPPSPEFAIELMATILREQPDLLAKSDKFLSKTMGVTVALLNQQTSTQSFNLGMTLRVFQWALVVLQTQSQALIECRELLVHILKPIQTATEACRRHHDFEDGFVYAGDATTYAEMDPKFTGPETASSRRLSGSDGTSSQNVSQTYSSLLPTASLWKAGLALETIYHVLRHCRGPELPVDGDEEQKSSFPLLDKDTMVVLAEGLSDYATICSCCQSHIMQLVDTCNHVVNYSKNSNSFGSVGSDTIVPVIARDEDFQPPEAIEPMLFHKAEQLIKSGTASTFWVGPASNSSGEKKMPPFLSSTSESVMGDTLWIAFNGILQIIVSILPTLPPNQMETVAEGSFAPALATFQHYLKRAPGSKDLTRLSLNGYYHLANVCMPATTDTRAIRRRALFTSLCKLSLPTWGKHDASSQLQNHHVRALICLLRIVHGHYNHIHSEWSLVLNTFEELSIMSISSPFLSDNIYHAALAVSAAFGRFAPFSTCFSNDSLDDFVKALASVLSLAAEKRDLITSSESAVLDRVLLSDPSAMADFASGKGVLEDGKESIGGKLVNLGVRAIYGPQSSDLSEVDGQYDVPIAKRTKSSFYEAYRNDFVRRFETTTAITMRPEQVAMLPFGLALLTDVAMANSFRYKICAIPIARHICAFASVAPAIKGFIMDTVGMLILCQISKDKNLISFNSPARIVFQEPKQNQLLAVEPAEGSKADKVDDGMSQAELFGPLCECIRDVESAAVAESGITVLASILESEGHNLRGRVWVVIISAIASLSGNSAKRRSSDWYNCCMLGFRCLRLVVDDFLDYLPSSDSENTARSCLLDCCSSFGCSRHDVNTSLTAIGLLWTIADQDAGLDAIDRAFSKLVNLASDSRPEVRNCSVNTLFSCIVGRGNTFTASQWRSCLCETVFGVYELVLAKANANVDGEVDPHGNSRSAKKSRYQVSVHHSRDTAAKQWVTTQVLVLRGLSRVLRTFYSQLLELVDDQSSTEKEVLEEIESSEEDTSYDEDDATEDHSADGTSITDYDGRPWFVRAWIKILDFSLQAAAQPGERDTLDLRNVGVEILVLCSQLSCRGGIQAAIIPARVGTNMQVVNGALRDVRNPDAPKDSPKNIQHSHSKVTDACRETLFLAAMERMDSYREFIVLDSHSGGEGSCMEATQIQVLHKYVTALSSFYDCCKDDELSPGGALRDRVQLAKFFKGLEGADGGHLECRFVSTVVTIAKAASSGTRFLSQAQRSAIDLLRGMIKNGSSEALLRSVQLCGPTFFCHKDDDKTGNGNTNQSSIDIVGAETGAIVAEVVGSEELSDVCKALALWLALSEFPSDSLSTGCEAEGRKKAYYKHFVPLLLEGLKSAKKLVLSKDISKDSSKNRLEETGQLVTEVWLKIVKAISVMLSPVTTSSGLRKIPRASELLEIIQILMDNVPNEFCEDICSVLSQGASKSLTVEKDNRKMSNGQSEGQPTDVDKMQSNFREDALQVFKSCYAAVCKREPSNRYLLTLTDQAFSDAVVAVNKAGDGNADESVSVDSFLMVCEALKENPGVEGLIVSSFPLLCKLVQTDHDTVRNAAAAALGAADVRQVLSVAREKCEKAEKRAAVAEKQVSELSEAIEDLQKKNEMLQKQVAVSALHMG